jgi:hypothetical protein
MLVNVEITENIYKEMYQSRTVIIDLDLYFTNIKSVKIIPDWYGFSIYDDGYDPDLDDNSHLRKNYDVIDYDDRKYVIEKIENVHTVMDYIEGIKLTPLIEMIQKEFTAKPRYYYEDKQELLENWAFEELGIKGFTYEKYLAPLLHQGEVFKNGKIIGKRSIIIKRKLSYKEESLKKELFERNCLAQEKKFKSIREGLNTVKKGLDSGLTLQHIADIRKNKNPKIGDEK